MGLFDSVESFAQTTLNNTINNFAKDSFNSVFNNIPYLSDLGFNVNNSNIFNTSVNPINDLDKYASELSFRNRFDFIFLLPTMLRKDDPNIQDVLRVFCRQFPVPSTATAVTKNKILNRTVSGVNGIDYDTINATFFDTKNLALHKLFTRWNQDKWNAKGLLQFYPDEYKTEVMILNYDGKVYLIKGIHPISVGDVVFSHDSVDEMLTFDVTFNVDSIEIFGDTKVSTSSSSLGFNTGIGFVDSIANYALGSIENYFSSKISSSISNATSSLTSKLGGLF